MILTSKILRNVFFSSLMLVFLLSRTAHGQSQSSQVITVSPSLFNVTVDPGEPWQSGLRVINSNNYELILYPSVMDFVPSGEGGTGRLMPQVDNEVAGRTLVDWINISSEPLIIPPQQTVSLPVMVLVPNDAPPGGHYAAIVVSSKPPDVESGAPTVQTAQVVTSLFFLTVDGDVIEQGSIREFGSNRQIYGRPEVDFNLRFENRGTVHIQPQGEITITNMWGQERGTIPVNSQTSFGNVLPDSVRQFNFSWNGEFSLSDLGRYRAEVALVYGTKSRQTVSANTYFWIIPLREIALVALVYIGILVLIGWSVKVYIRRILRQALPMQPPVVKSKAVATPAATPDRSLLVTKPKAKLTSGWIRLQAFVRDKQLYLTIAAIILGVIMTWLFFSEVLRSDTYYEVSIGGETPVTLSAEDITYQKLRSENPLTAAPSQSLPVKITNASGQAGLGAAARVRLEDAGYEVLSVETDLVATIPRTIVLFNASYAEEAEALSTFLGGSPVSVVPDAGPALLHVRIGSDY